MDRRTIPIDKDTRDRLRGAKQDGETYDDAVNRLLDEANE
mgnify:CR=1 FL=1